MEVVESREIPEEQEPPEPLSEEISLPLTPGESYQEPEGAQPSEQGAEETAGADTEAEMERAEEVAESVAEPITEPVAEPFADAFHRHVDEGFARLSEKDWIGAQEQWSAALKIRPNDDRLRANLRRLEKKMGEG